MKALTTLCFLLLAATCYAQNVFWGFVNPTTEQIELVVTFDAPNNKLYSNLFAPMGAGWYESGYLQCINDHSVTTEPGGEDIVNLDAPSMGIGIDVRNPSVPAISFQFFGETDSRPTWYGKVMSPAEYKLVRTPCGYYAVIKRGERGHCETHKVTIQSENGERPLSAWYDDKGKELQLLSPDLQEKKEATDY
jgi:hypothetical protein